jgi:hypothetical protein
VRAESAARRSNAARGEGEAVGWVVRVVRREEREVWRAVNGGLRVAFIVVWFCDGVADWWVDGV